METVRVQALLSRSEGGWIVYGSDLDIAECGSTIQEAIQNFRVVVRGHAMLSIDDKKPLFHDIPKSDRCVRARYADAQVFLQEYIFVFPHDPSYILSMDIKLAKEDSELLAC